MKVIKTAKYIKAQEDYFRGRSEFFKKDREEQEREEQEREEMEESPRDRRIREETGETVDIYARYIGDYLAYAEYASKPEAESERYWPDYYDSDHDISESETVLLKNVPTYLAEELVAQGSSEQFFSDGYEAANAAAPYVEEREDEIESEIDSLEEELSGKEEDLKEFDDDE